MISESTFKSALDLSPVPVLIVNSNFYNFSILYANKFFCDISKLNKNEVEGKSVLEVFERPGESNAIDEHPLVAALKRALLTQKETKSPVIKYVGGERKANKRYFQCKITPSFDENERIEFLLITAIDVTERLRVDRELKKTWQRTIVAQQIAKTGYWEDDLVQNKNFWSDEVYSILGIEKDESVIGLRLFFEHVHPEDRDEFLKERMEAMSGGKCMNLQIRIVTPTGVIKWVHQLGYLVKNKNGETVSLRGIIKDITATKSLELIVAESNKRYQHLSRALFDTVYEYDLVQDKFLWTEGYLDNFGYGSTELNAPQFWLKHIHPEDADIARQRLSISLHSDADSFSNEYRFQKSDGNYVNVAERCTFLRDKDGVAVKMIGTMQDITEKKNLEKLLKKSNKLSKIGSWEIDFKTNSVYWSDTAKEIHDAPLYFEPTLEESKSYFKDDATKELVSKRIREAIRHGKSWQDDLQILTFKGQSKWVRIIGEPEFVNGKCTKIQGSFQDIDEIKKTEIEVRRLLAEKNQLLESIGEAFIRVEKDWTVTYWNKIAEMELKIPRERIINRKIWEVFPLGLNTITHQKFQAAFDTNRRVDFENYFYIFEKWLQASVFPSDNGLSIFFRDISQQKTAQIKLQESESRYSELFRLNPNPIWIFDTDTYRLVQVNQATVDMYGYSEEELLNMTVLELRPPEDIPVLKKALKGHDKSDGFILDRFTHWTKSREIKLVEIKSKLINIKGKQYRLAIVNDITERERANQAITRAIIQTQENERYEIGAELHDNVCQILASTYVRMGVILPSINETGLTVFKQCRDYVHLATQEIRNLSHRLAPAALNNTSLKDSVEELISTINIEEKYAISLFIDDNLHEADMSKELRLNLYRILQEQLRNIIKYAKCTNIDIGIIKYNNKITMHVVDDGVGFNPKKITGGIGLSNMKRRTELFGGKFEIISSPGKGCELNISIPLEDGQKMLPEKNGSSKMTDPKVELGRKIN